MSDEDYLERLGQFELMVSQFLPEVLPEGMENDGWAGAGGCEVRDESHYEPFVHRWDLNLAWCQLTLLGRATRGGREPEGWHYDEIHPELIPGDIYRRALRFNPRARSNTNA